MSNYVFGPVPSRRLGRSLGIDLVPYKTCTYDCIYCQLGRTTCKTLARKEWVPLEAVLAELRPKLSARPDYVTLNRTAGGGWPQHVVLQSANFSKSLTLQRAILPLSSPANSTKDYRHAI